MSLLTRAGRHERAVLLPSFRRNWHLIAGTIGFSLLAAVFEGFSIGMLIPFLQNLSSDSAMLQTGVEWIDQNILAVDGTTLDRMYRICAVMLIATWLRTIFNYLSNLQGTKARAYVVEDLRMRMIDQLQDVSLRFFSTTRGGVLLNTMTGELQRTSHALNIFVTVLSQVMLTGVYVTLMILVSWELSVLVIVFFVVLSGGLTFLMRRIRTSGEKVTHAAAHFISLATEFVSGVKTVMAFNQQPYERARFESATSDYAEAMIETRARELFIRPFSQAVVGTLLVVIIVIAVQFYVLEGKLDLALLLGFLLALFRLMPIVHQINGSRSEWAGMRAALTSVADILRRDDKPYLTDGTQTAPPLSEGLVFENVSFSYDGTTNVLKDVNLTVQRGKTTAVVGASGSGKSTLVDLIPRFHDPDSGTVRWDGTDLRSLSIRSLRDRISIVSQSTFIFNDTVANNIAYGVDELSMDEIREAARRANALDFIEEMEHGFDTMLGDRGTRLSGGQRQRIAIARAILRNPEFLILDEATSALDSASEALVQESLENLMEGRTVVAVAHRLSTIENADWVIVLEHGRIVEQGTYADLLERRGQLWRYHSIQFQAA